MGACNQVDAESEQEFVDFGGWRNQMGEQMSRNAFPECEREYNKREEAVEMAREERTDRQEPPGLRYKVTAVWDDGITVHEGVYKGGK